MISPTRYYEMKDRLEEIFERENLRTPSMFRRIMAYTIDDLLISLLMVVILWDRIEAHASDPEAMIGIINAALLEIVAIRFFYQWIFVTFYGATLGKMLFKMRVVSIDTLDNPALIPSAIRSAIRAAGEILFYIPLVVAFMDSFKQALHDKVAKTVVVSLA